VEAPAAPVEQYPSTGTYAGAPVKAALQPIDSDGSSVFKAKSTVSLKFWLLDASGNLVTDPSVIDSLYKVADSRLPAGSTVDEPVSSDSPSSTFRYDASSQLFVYNLSTKNLKAGMQYTYQVRLDDGSSFTFKFGLK
jgi:hypothetical protein